MWIIGVIVMCLVDSIYFWLFIGVAVISLFAGMLVEDYKDKKRLKRRHGRP